MVSVPKMPVNSSARAGSRRCASACLVSMLRVFQVGVVMMLPLLCRERSARWWTRRLISA